nr:hypothetical protein [uncultured Gellertiella sp.]
MAASIKLCANLDQRLRALAKERNCSQHWMMCEAIKRFIEEEECKMFREQEARRGWGVPADGYGAHPKQ